MVEVLMEFINNLFWGLMNLGVIFKEQLSKIMSYNRNKFSFEEFNSKYCIYS